MDDEGIGIIAIILILVGVVIVGVVATGIGMYASDAAIEATVQEDCDVTGGIVPVKTKLFGLEHKVEGIDRAQCLLVKEGQFVQYHLKSERTVLYEKEGGTCLWDTDKSTGHPC